MAGARGRAGAIGSVSPVGPGPMAGGIVDPRDVTSGSPLGRACGAADLNQCGGRRRLSDPAGSAGVPSVTSHGRTASVRSSSDTKRHETTD